MPKRRVPGHLQRTGRRRRDRTPNIPNPPADHGGEASPENQAQVVGGPPGVPPGRPLRPTQRAAAGARFVRTQQPTMDLSVEYQHVVRDLRQIGLLAALAFLVLGVLALVIR